MENEKRKEFINRFAVLIDAARIKKFNEENKKMKPSIGQIVEGYKTFVSDLGGGFLEIAENYNDCLQIAKLNELIGDVKLKARIKDFSSSKTNSDVKILDDVFGMELVTPTELEKEILILFNHLLFQINKDKKYNKKSGYVAYHCMADFSPKEGKLEEKIKQIVEKSKTKEYIYSKSEPNYEDERNLTDVFPILNDYISEPKNLTELTRVFQDMLTYMRNIAIPRESIPIIEFHFLTSEVAEKAIRGSASHSNYKKINTKLIKEYFEQGRLIRGINAPWKFIGDTDGLKLQDFYDTLLENWPFLKELIVEKRNLGREEREKERISKFDVLTASQFSFLRKYLKGNYEYPEEQNAEKWGLLKGIIIANKINRNEKSARPVEDELVEEIGNIWQ